MLMNKTGEDAIKFFAKLYAEEAVMEFFSKHYADVMQSHIQKQFDDLDIIAEVKRKIDSLLISSELPTQRALGHLDNKIEVLSRNMDALYHEIQGLKRGD